MRRVLFGTPTFDGKVIAEFFFSFSQTVKLCLPRQVEFFPVLPKNDPVHHARNKIIASAVEHDFDDLIMIDADQDWKPEDVLRILNHPVDCVGAPIRRKMEAEAYNVRCTTPMRPDTGHGIITSDDMAVGCGFIRLSRRAIQALWAANEPYKVWGDNETYRHVFKWSLVTQLGDNERGDVKTLRAEDIGMCDQLREMGIAVWVDPSIMPGHFGDRRYAANFLPFLQEQRRQQELRTAERQREQEKVLRAVDKANELGMPSPVSPGPDLRVIEGFKPG